MESAIRFAVAGVGLLFLAVASAAVLRRLWSCPELPDFNSLSESPESKYAPMARLLSQEDLTFLRSQPGFGRDSERRFRRERARVFRGYCRSMRQDFSLVMSAARVIAASGQASQDFSGDLIGLQFAFKRTLWQAAWAAWLFERGWNPAAVSTMPAVDALSRLRQRLDLASFAAASAAS